MPDRLNLWLASTSLYRQAVRLLGDETPPEGLLDRVTFANGVTLNHAANVNLLPDPKDAAVDSKAAFLDARYDAIEWAADAGWRTAWFNPQGAFAPEANPIQDVDFLDLSQLSEVDQALDKPSLGQCLDWWEAWEVPKNIRQHSRAVGRSAYHLAVMLRNQGISMDPILAQRGGLLHDIDKISTLYQSGAHGQVGADFIEEQGYPALAEIVREHIMSTILHPHAEDWHWEVKLVYFCDKLVEGEQLVSFDQRLEALVERYPHYRETMGRAAGPVRALSDQICAILEIPGHEALIEKLRDIDGNMPPRPH